MMSNQSSTTDASAFVPLVIDRAESKEAIKKLEHMRRPSRGVLLFCLSFLGLLSAFSLLVAAEASEPQTPPISEPHQMQGRFIPTRGVSQQASLNVLFDDTNCLFHEQRYEFVLHSKHVVKIGFYADGNFTLPATNSAQAIISRKDGLVIETDDLALQEKIEAIKITMRYAPKRIRIENHLVRVTHAYDLLVELLDSDQKQLGRYALKLLEKTEVSPIQLGLDMGQPGPPRPTTVAPDAPTGLFYWLREQGAREQQPRTQ